MNLFNRKQPGLRHIWSVGNEPEVEITQPKANYETAVEWLVGLSDEDFAKVVHVVTIYRDSDKEACKVLGAKYEPLTFIDPPSNVEQIAPHLNHKKSKSFLDDDDFNPKYLEEEVKPSTKKKKA